MTVKLLPLADLQEYFFRNLDIFEKKIIETFVQKTNEMCR